MSYPKVALIVAVVATYLVWMNWNAPATEQRLLVVVGVVSLIASVAVLRVWAHRLHAWLSERDTGWMSVIGTCIGVGLFSLDPSPVVETVALSTVVGLIVVIGVVDASSRPAQVRPPSTRPR